MIVTARTCNCHPESPFHWRDQTQDTGMAIATMRQAEANERFAQVWHPTTEITTAPKKPKATVRNSVAKLLREATILANKHGGQYTKAKG